MGRVFKRRGRSRGQSLAEFALVFPVFIALVGGVVQFGMVFWQQNTLTQVVRDTGRWAATQNATPCESAFTALTQQADSIAANASLWGHTSNEFKNAATNDTATGYGSGGDASVNAFDPATNPNAMAVAWVLDAQPSPPAPAQSCPPSSNAAVYHVTIRMNQQIPTFFPGMQYLPGLGTCDSNGCHIVLSSTAQFRMEPAP